ncbi:MAG: hypothetical protein ACLFN2_07040 [Bacteroidales bacterium]
MEKKNRRHFLKLMATLPAAVFANRILNGQEAGTRNAPIYDIMHKKATSYIPGYVSLHESGELKKRGEALYGMMQNCKLCPRECGADRLSGKRGHCNANATLEISSAHPHYGEERELVGRRGSGTVFFTNCGLLCVYCINYEISHLGEGREYDTDSLADIMLVLERNGCHNINIVTPSHYSPHILLALDQAASRGLRTPLVYNTCGWEKESILKYLDGVVDVYLADFKYMDTEAADTYSPGADCYPETTQKALLEMHRQVGVAETDPETNLISKGLMIRHLVMPENAARSDKVIRWIAGNLPKNTYVNIMSQYTPIYKAIDYPEISRRITSPEYNNVVTIARQEGLTNLRLQMQ